MLRIIALCQVLRAWRCCRRRSTQTLLISTHRAGHRQVAEPLLRQSQERACRSADPGAAVAALNNLAPLLAESGRLDVALVNAREALRLRSEHGDQHRLAALPTNLADLLHRQGQLEAALEQLTESARLFAAVDPGGPIRPEIWALVEW